MQGPKAHQEDQETKKKQKSRLPSGLRKKCKGKWSTAKYKSSTEYRFSTE